jgi:hypothetical protein
MLSPRYSRADGTASHFVSLPDTLTRFSRHPLNLRHIVVLDWSGVTVIPINGDTIPSHSDDHTKIGPAKLSLVANSRVALLQTT